MASITDVARLAGVSPATVSRVLSSAHYAVSPATRERVLEAARTLDFVPNALARGLLKSYVPVVGVIVHDITDPYFADVVRGVEDAAAAGNYLVITCSSDRIAERENSYVRLLRSMRASTLIFAGSGLDDPALNQEVRKHIAAMRAYGAAVVHLSPHPFGDPEVSVDNARGMTRIVEALIALGHQRIAFLPGPSTLYVGRHRHEGYKQALTNAGIAYDPRLVVSTSFNREGGVEAVDRLLAGDAPFTAVCAANDLMALGALQRFAELGIGVPEAVSVTGFDDIRMASMVAPSLSTVRLPLYDLGHRGFEFAEKLLAGSRPRRQTLPTEVVMRNSTARAPAAALPGAFRRGATAVPEAAASMAARA
ncbi:MAG TPA: LacI family DNA-binding transcriptional regulator [Candidatus Limnocylindria bacterium]|nr:LacI family DNA-binding transcriptional regulator [Candidatus Limnocylindria bacterium]